MPAKKANTNRKYKDSVFTLLFGEKKNLLELYNAIENTNYGSETDIKMTTLRNVLYRKRINDISFVLNGRLVVLIEHQSSINGNMPIRMLMYISEIYKGLIKGNKNIFHKKAISIPRPEFIVLYNGNEKYPDKGVLKLARPIFMG
jgi:predicted transposase/invertase (TIGR01784 family)